ncbi:hypothetical protein NP233_g12121 [Leucocoprinus birnbaumii]|uniref:MYND-type domain-containing protein n=1 Tax=Leucocoprinus birnbaumii TaxID=56174 RepID=A0AAD5VFP5_9AGAR|nr:hypothetical protein NP233_g12121 [Leucocoprinus birnbaumii]
MGRLDEAVDQLQKAIDWRKTKGNATDCAVSVENLAQVWEAKGDLGKALETRVGYDVHHMVCGNDECPGAVFQKSHLKTCGRCKSVFYCGARCQKLDWKARHKKYCKTSSEL